MDIQIIARPDCPAAEALQESLALAMQALRMPPDWPIRLDVAPAVACPELRVDGVLVSPCFPAKDGVACPACGATHDNPDVEIIRWHLAAALGKKTVLLLCSGNAVRSQMAEAIVNHVLGDQWAAFSGGIFPMMLWKPVVQVLKEIGIDARNRKSKHIELFLGCHFDVIISLCSNADDFCTAFPGQGVRKHMPFDDPMTSPFFGFGDLGRTRDLRNDMRNSLCDYLRGIP
ncbi:MAG: arsenate reductase ArsC [Rhodocyclaceae bacterium]|nr:arsenate reductase ArsC [Rhodocyclaceae bacterium]